jgi:hypothetical protein
MMTGLCFHPGGGRAYCDSADIKKDEDGIFWKASGPKDAFWKQKLYHGQRHG